MLGNRRVRNNVLRLDARCLSWSGGRRRGRVNYLQQPAARGTGPVGSMARFQQTVQGPGVWASISEFMAEPDIPKTITPRIAVLSLVSQRADTVADISRRLKEEFPAAQFPESSAHNNVRKLAAAGYLRLVEEGPEPSLNRYEATDEGKELARRWRLRSVIPPMTRDTMQGRLAFIEGEAEIRGQIALVREEERGFQVQHDRAYSRARSQKLFRDTLSGIDVGAELEAIRLKDEYELLMVMVRRCMQVRKELEALLARLDKG
jgi:DNA-binding PadR family transcriptional regulator